MARPEGLEPPTLCSEGRCSIQLSYGRVTPILPERSLKGSQIIRKPGHEREPRTVRAPGNLGESVLQTLGGLLQSALERFHVF
jgi:hypothetical protein